MLTFKFLVHACTSELYLGFLSKDYKAMSLSLEFIRNRLNIHCPSVVFINAENGINIDMFVEAWIESFFFPICENGSSMKELIGSYLLL